MVLNSLRDMIGGSRDPLLRGHTVYVTDELEEVPLIQFEGTDVNHSLELGGENFRDKLQSTGTHRVRVTV